MKYSILILALLGKSFTSRDFSQAITRLPLSLFPPSLWLESVMGTSDEIAYLKSLVSQLNEKIHALEAGSPTKRSPAQQLRTILMGPPGAGTSILF